MFLSPLSSSDELFDEISIGSVETPISQNAPGRVKFRGTTWFAQFYDPSYESPDVGERIEILGRNGTTLLVMPVSSKSGIQPSRTLART